MNLDELIVIRQILNNMAKRKFFHGFQLLSVNLTFSCLMLEGRIWKSIILNFSNEQVFEIWKNYIESIKPLTIEFFVPTIKEAYRLRLKKKEIGSDDDIVKIHEREELEKEINLNPVFDFKDLLKIMFAYKNKDAALYFIENYQKIPNLQISPDVFEVCLQNDEDITILVAHKAINNDNAKESYMHTSLIKKYFRLAVRLLKFKTCKNFLNSKPPEDDQSYLIMQRMHLKEKKDLYKNLELEKRLNQSKTNEEPTTDNILKMNNSAMGSDKKITSIMRKNLERNNNSLLKIDDEEQSNSNSEKSSSLNTSRLYFTKSRSNSFAVKHLRKKFQTEFNLYINFNNKSHEEKSNLKRKHEDINNIIPCNNKNNGDKNIIDNQKGVVLRDNGEKGFLRSSSVKISNDILSKSLKAKKFYAKYLGHNYRKYNFNLILSKNTKHSFLNSNKNYENEENPHVESLYNKSSDPSNVNTLNSNVNTNTNRNNIQKMSRNRKVSLLINQNSPSKKILKPTLYAKNPNKSLGSEKDLEMNYYYISSQHSNSSYAKDSEKSYNISKSSKIADKESLFHPENTKNKRNINDIHDQSYDSSRDIQNNPDLLILRENEFAESISKKNNNINDQIFTQNNIQKDEERCILSEIGYSPKFDNKFHDDQNNFMSVLTRTLKSNMQDNMDPDVMKNSQYNNLDESIGNETYFNQIRAQRSFKKNDEENKISNDFSINVQSILIDNLRLGHYTFYCLSLLSSIHDRYLITDYSDKICKYFLVFTRDEDGISRCRYPILVCVLAAEFLYRLGRLNLKYQYKCHSVATMMLQLGESLQSAVKDEEMLNYYLRDQTDFKNRSTLEIIAENRFYELLNDENVAAIVSKLWYGTGKNLNLWKFCRITRILSSNIKHEQYDDVINRTKIEMKTKNYSFQYEQYIKNCSTRYLVDSVSTILTTFFYQVIIYFYVSVSKTGDPNADSTFRYYNYIANCIVFTINLNLILYLLYVYKTNRKLKFNIWIFLDIIMFLAVLSNFLNLSKSLSPNDLDLRQLIDSLIYSIIIICAWMRVISILMTTRTFGPFLRTIYLLSWTVFNFLLVFFAINTVFAQIFTIIFKKTNESFRTFFQSWITLFNASFGIYDFTQFTQIKVFGYSLLIAYITLTNVMLLNLVIAIINNLFNFYEKKADAENRAVLVLTYERIKWDNEYGLLILLPAPFNLISIIFILILLTVPDRKREELNSIFSKIAYFLVAIANFFMLILWSFLFLPSAYLKSLAHSSYDNYSKFQIIKFYRIIYVIITRPFVLVYYIWQDINNFWKILYLKPTEVDSEKRMLLVNKEVIYNLRKLLFDYKYRYKKKIISLDELYQRLGLNKKRIKENGLISKSSSDGSKNNMMSDNLNSTPDLPYQSNTHADSNSSNGSLANTTANKNNLVLINNELNPNNHIFNNNAGNLKNELSRGAFNNISPKALNNLISNNNFNNMANINISNRNSNINNTQNNSPGDSRSMSKETNSLKIDNSLAYRYLVDKIVDKDKFIDIDRILVLLPARVKYTQHFLESLQHLNMRFILRGLRNFFFINAVNNPIYSYKKLQHMIYKILIKFKMIFNYIPESTLDKIRNEYREINKNEAFLKSFDNLRKMEEADELSDYDDQGEYANYVNNNNNFNQNTNYTANTLDNSDNNSNNNNQKNNHTNTSSNSLN